MDNNYSGRRRKKRIGDFFAKTFIILSLSIMASPMTVQANSTTKASTTTGTQNVPEIANIAISDTSKNDTYHIDTDSNENGKIILVNKVSDVLGESIVQFQLSPNKGYYLKVAYVTDGSGKRLPITQDTYADKSNGKVYVFTMPKSTATIHAEFIEATQHTIKIESDENITVQLSEESGYSGNNVTVEVGVLINPK